MTQNNIIDDEFQEILRDTDMYMSYYEENWLLPGPIQEEDDQLLKLSNVSNIELKSTQNVSSKSSGPDSKRHARFKTQVIKYEEPPLGDSEDIDLEPPPSFSSLDDFIPQTPAISTQNGKPNAISNIQNGNGIDLISPLTLAKLVPHTMANNVKTTKASALDRINAIKLKYASPKDKATDEELSLKTNKLSLLNKTLEEVGTNRLSMLNNNLFIATPPSPSAESKSILNADRCSPGEPLKTTPKLKKQRTFEILDDIEDDYGDDPYSTMVMPQTHSQEYNGVQDPSTTPPPNGSDLKRSEMVNSTPKLKKQGTFEILDEPEEDDGDDPYQTMILPPTDSDEVKKMQYDLLHSVSFTSTPKSHHQLNNSFTLIKNNKLAIYNEEKLLSTSFTIEKHASPPSNRNTSVTYLNGAEPQNSDQAPNENENNMNRSFVVSRNCEAEQNGVTNEAHMNALNTSFTVVNSEQVVEYGETNNALNASFTVTKHYDENGETNALNSSDINDNVVNGKYIEHRVNTNTTSTSNSYRTFTRPKKPTGNASRSSGLQRRSIMKPTVSNVNAMNSTFSTEPPSNLNETISKTSNSRFSTITRPKSKLSYVGQTQVKPATGNTSSIQRLKNSSSTESLKSNESYVISRPNGTRGGAIQNRRSIYKSTGALNVAAHRDTGYAKVQSTENLSVKSGGSDSEGSNSGSAIPKPSGLLRPGFSRIPAPASRISSAPSSSRPSMLQKYSAPRRV
ncbi:hypothetical protein M8J76_007729 [Diaphorina citri]|nr:hypothetical protein M8J75_005530 [Diaphorina citri]KAI5733106.1 hypothetical protein M8J76_007729 [Diaphorina citri]